LIIYFDSAGRCLPSLPVSCYRARQQFSAKGVNLGVEMPEKSGRLQILISCASAVFWPGAFIFGFPGVMSQHWQQAFNVGRSEVGQTVFFILAGATCFMYLCGRWQEKYGPGKLVALGAGLCGSSAIWLGQVENITAVYVWAFLVGAS
jgi:OFA family oxalate/formate antiporter-like MFS transporter